MGRYVLRRLFTMVPVLLGVTVLTFLLTNLIPGDPAQWIAGEYATPEQLAAVRERLGLDQPLYVQYFRYVGRLVQGDLGTSITSRAPIVQELKVFFPASLELTLVAMAVTIVVGVPLGVLTGARRSPWLNSSAVLASLVGVGMPVFWAALVLQLIFFGKLHLLPLSGRLSVGVTPPPAISGMFTLDALLAGQWGTFTDALQHLVLPSFTLAISRVAAIARITHASMVDVMHKDYIRTARAKGLVERGVVARHALKNALLPTLTTLGMQFGWLLGGTILIENIFSWGGLGTYAWIGIFRNDIPVVMGMTLLTTTAFVFINLLTDLSYVFLRPAYQLRLNTRISSGQVPLDARATDSLPPTGYRPLATRLGWMRRSFRRSNLARAIRNNPVAVLGLVIVLAFLVVSLAPGLFTSYSPTKLRLQERLSPPSSLHPFGTDMLGMDILARVLYGARVTLRNVILVLGIAVGIGQLIGSTAGYFGGKTDEILMRVTDVFLAFPVLVLAIAVNAALGRGLLQTMAAVGFSWWPGYARLIRGQILSVKYDEYVLAARSVGASSPRILARHILPNCYSPVIVRITLDIGFVALTTAGLSFLGLGAAPPTPEWGRMVAEGRDFLLNQWWVSTFPGLALFLVVVGFNLLGEILRDWLDPTGIGR